MPSKRQFRNDAVWSSLPGISLELQRKSGYGEKAVRNALLDLIREGRAFQSGWKRSRTSKYAQYTPFYKSGKPRKDFVLPDKPMAVASISKEKYRKAHKQLYREASKKWYWNNREQRLISMRQYRETHEPKRRKKGSAIGFTAQALMGHGDPSDSSQIKPQAAFRDGKLGR